MAWDIKYTDEFGDWWETLTEAGGAIIMARPFSELRDKMSPERRERGQHIQDGTAHGYVHQYPAQLHPGHGGEPEIIARFPDGSVQINQFEELGVNQP